MSAHEPEPALIVVDVQQGFLTPQTEGTVGPILEHLRVGDRDTRGSSRPGSSTGRGRSMRPSATGAR